MLRIFLLSVPVCLLIGILIGLIFRRRTVLQICAALVISIVYFAILEWKIGDPDEWSWKHPIASAMYLVVPFFLLFLAPMVVAALVIGSKSADT